MVNLTMNLGVLYLIVQIICNLPHAFQLSPLGRVLFLDEPPPPAKHKTFQIVLWDTFNAPGLNNQVYIEPQCPVQNCVKINKQHWNEADVIVSNGGIASRSSKRNYLSQHTRRANQIWVFYALESPVHMETTIPLQKINEMEFNWTMTYKRDSDIPIPYGYTRRRRDKLVEYPKPTKPDSKTQIVALISNCNPSNDRNNIVQELQKYIDVDVKGNCSRALRSGNYPVNSFEDYMFHLAFENSNCKEYITEKTWWHSFLKFRVPIYYGAPPSDCQKLLPPGSYIHVNQFPSLRHLAQHLQFLINHPNAYNNYFKWHRDYEVVQNHGMYGNQYPWFCSICQALNYNEIHKQRIVDLNAFWNKQKDCKR